MVRDIKEILPILIQIEEAFARLYHNVATIEGQYNPKLKSTALVLSRQEKDHAQYYNELSMKKEILEGITVSEDFFQEIKKTLIIFKDTIHKSTFSTTNELLEFAIAYEKKNGYILRELSDELEKKSGYVELKALLAELLEAEERHSSTLEHFLK